MRLHGNTEHRVKRMREQWARGEEVVQGVLRQLFPPDLWLYPGSRWRAVLWAVAQTATP